MYNYNIFWYYIKQIFYLYLLILPLISFALPWQIQDGLLNKKYINELKKKYPDILNEKQAYELVNAIVSINKLLTIQIHKYTNYWLITGKPAQKIIKIHIKVDLLKIRSHLQAIVNEYINLINSEDTQNTIIQRLKKELENLGFPLATIKLYLKSIDEGVIYNFKINLHSPCLWAKVSLKMKLIPGITFQIQEGDVCNIFKVEEAINQLKFNLTQKGYIGHNIKPPLIIYDPKINMSHLIIQGNIGYKVKYTIVDTDKTKNFNLLLKDNTNINQLADDPQSVKNVLEEQYKNLGYNDIIIENPIKKATPHTIEYIFNITKGPQYKLTAIKFNGNIAYSEQELLQKMFLSKTWQVSNIFNLSTLKEGINNLKNFYQANGYWDINIADPVISKNPTNNTMQALISIKEGYKRILDKISINGNHSINTEDILKLFTLNYKDPITAVNLLNFEKAIKNLYINKGFLNTKIKYNLKFTQQKNVLLTQINVNIDEGKRVKISKIIIKGLNRTNPKVILRELNFTENSWYTPKKIETSRKALINLGIFKSVIITTKDNDDVLSYNENEIQVIITVQEADPINISFGPGWSLYKGAKFSIEGSYKNIGGEGRQLFSSINISEEANQKPIGSATLLGRSLNIGYLEPYIFDLPFNASISFSNIAKADEQWSIAYIFETALSHRFKSFWKDGIGSLFYSHKFNIEKGATEQYEGYLYLIGGNTKTSKIGIRYNIDKRNNLLWPSDGYILSMEASHADKNLGSTIAYDSISVTSSAYIQTIEKLVCAIGISIASYQNIKRFNSNVADILPVSETIHIGGADSIRGFKDRSLGPLVQYDVFDEEGTKLARDKSEVIGGSQSAIYKLELRYPLIPLTLGISTFIDGGNVFFSKKEISNFNEKEIKYNEKYNSTIINEEQKRTPSKIIDNESYSFIDIIKRPKNLVDKNYFSYGLAFNYLTPIGSINISYGIPWKRCASNRSTNCIKRGKQTKHWYTDGELHFNIGAVF